MILYEYLIIYQYMIIYVYYFYISRCYVYITNITTPLDPPPVEGGTIFICKIFHYHYLSLFHNISIIINYYISISLQYSYLDNDENWTHINRFAIDLITLIIILLFYNIIYLYLLFIYNLLLYTRAPPGTLIPYYLLFIYLFI